jgi:hypothetical protein
VSRLTCPHCGTNLPAVRDAFCSACRRELDSPPDALPPSSPPAGHGATKPTKPRSPLAVVLMIVGGFASAAVGAQFIAPAMSGHPPGPEFTRGQLLMAAVSGAIGAWLGWSVGQLFRSAKSSTGAP